MKIIKQSKSILGVNIISKPTQQQLLSLKNDSLLAFRPSIVLLSTL